MTEEQINILIADAETFIYFKQKKIDGILHSKGIISAEDTSQIFKHFAETLEKISKLLSKAIEIENRERLNDVFEISINTLAWITYTIPTLEIYTNLFPENFTLKNKEILDFLAINMIELENIMANVKPLKTFSLDISENLKQASSLFGHLHEISKKGIHFN